MSPNPEDLNFLLGSTVHRGRSSGAASTVKSPATETQHREVTRSSSEGKITAIPVQPANRNESSTSTGGTSSSKTLVRKKSAPVHSSHPITIPSNDNSMDEELFMDVILQRHVRKMLTSGISFIVSKRNKKKKKMRIKEIFHCWAHFFFFGYRLQ